MFNFLAFKAIQFFFCCFYAMSYQLRKRWRPRWWNIRRNLIRNDHHLCLWDLSCVCLLVSCRSERQTFWKTDFGIKQTCIPCKRHTVRRRTWSKRGSESFSVWEHIQSIRLAAIMNDGRHFLPVSQLQLLTDGFVCSRRFVIWRSGDGKENWKEVGKRRVGQSSRRTREKKRMKIRRRKKGKRKRQRLEGKKEIKIWGK